MEEMLDSADRSSVTLDRREEQGRRSSQNRRDTDRRTADLRSGDDRRKEDLATDFSDRRTQVRRAQSDRREDARRTDDRRQTGRRAETADAIGVSEEDFISFGSPPISRARALSQILLIGGLLFLLTRL